MMGKRCDTYDATLDKVGYNYCAYGCCETECCQRPMNTIKPTPRLPTWNWNQLITNKPMTRPKTPKIPTWNWNQLTTYKPMTIPKTPRLPSYWDHYTIPDLHFTVKPPHYVAPYHSLVSCCLRLNRRDPINRYVDVECAQGQTRPYNGYNQPGAPISRPTDLPRNVESSNQTDRAPIRRSSDPPRNVDDTNQTGRAATRLLFITDQNPNLRVGDVIRFPNLRSAPANGNDNTERDARTLIHSAGRSSSDRQTNEEVTNGQTPPNGEDNQAADVLQSEQTVSNTDNLTDHNPRSELQSVQQTDAAASGQETRNRGPIEFIIITPRFRAQPSQTSDQARPADCIMDIKPESPNTRRAGLPWPYVAGTNTPQSDTTEGACEDPGFTCPGLTSMWDKEKQ
ncbi:hypothetical protein MAR_020860 [Mya arenaria]|uniref:Uncharacterized protein n=1 Tax=Mya arenaria TaxID=6604 RepID=A0ABY7EA35_MYAAR|nr:hypothetical protein MAR_020860 [Mya arenaria]